MKNKLTILFAVFMFFAIAGADSAYAQVGYGGGITTGSRARSTAPSGQVLGAATSQCSLLINDYLKQGQANNAFEVYKLQAFLSAVGFSTPLTGYFGPITDANVRSFQSEHAADILRPWTGFQFASDLTPTGYVYKTTKWKINNIYCPGSEAHPTLEAA